jgi:hypothetical protein
MRRWLRQRGGSATSASVTPARQILSSLPPLMVLLQRK